jgi:hypothetical protein
VVHLTAGLLLCAACALILACSGGEARPAPEPRRSAEPEVAATLNTLAATVTGAAPASATPAATPVPPTAAPALPPAATAPAAATASSPAPAATPLPTAATRPAPVTLRLTLDTAGQTFGPHQVHGNFDDAVVLTVRGSGERHSFTVPVIALDQTISERGETTVSFSLPLALGGAAQEGIFPFYCRFHGTPTSGMHGLLIFH